MPRVSSAPEDAYHFKGSFQDGWGEVVDSKSVIFQYPPQREVKNNRPAGYQDPPQLCAELMIQRHIDGDGNKAGAQPEQVLLSICKPGKDTGRLDNCHPGNFPDGDLEAEPEDAGGELGAEGNTLYAMQDGFQINDKTKWMNFTQSLVEKGFKPAILKRTYFPDLIGLRAYFTNVTLPKKAGDDFDTSVFVVKEIRQFPYEKTAAKPAAAKGKPAAAANAKAAPAAKATGPAASASAVNGAATTSGDPEEIALAIVMETLAPSQSGQLLPDIKQLRIKALLAVGKHKPAVPNELKKAVNDTMTADWLEAMGPATGLYKLQADGGVQFA